MSKRKWTTGISEYIRAYLLKLAKKGIEEKNAIKNGGDEPT